jgi:hypothetical protein
MTIVNVEPLLTEQLFQHIWQCRLFSQSDLTTLEGERVRIDYPGQHNRHAGPDFTAARIQIGQQLWAGNVELHLRTSDWYKHGHQHNAQYQRAILHVVFQHDMPELTTQGVPCLELQHCIPKLLLQRYTHLKEAAAFIPCGGAVRHISPLVWLNWKDRLLVERLEQKADVMKGWLLQTKYDWEEVCYLAMARGLGVPVNSEQLLQLARSLPYKLLRRHQHHQLQLEALLFGQAGMLERTFTEDYPLALQREYAFMRRKYRLQPLSVQQWKWLRMRPVSFPTIRIASLAALVHQSQHPFSLILEATDIGTLEKLLHTRLSDYWSTHYNFEEKQTRLKSPGEQSVRHLLINTILPLLYLYGREKQESSFQERAIQWMHLLPAEDNHIIRDWNELGINANSAADSQALLQLKQHYCDEKRCLQCNAGAKLLKDGVR